MGICYNSLVKRKISTESFWFQVLFMVDHFQGHKREKVYSLEMPLELFAISYCFQVKWNVVLF